MKIAVTGGIGSGKSFVCHLLEKRGFTIYDCDNAAKRIIATSDVVKSKLKHVVGDNVFTGNTLNKAVLSKFLLESNTNTQVINNIIHPAVALDFVNSKKNWMECAILFSSGFDRLVDKVICVTAPLDVRLTRIMTRDGISKEKALEWINKQMSQEDVIKLSDYVIENDGKADLDKQITDILVSLNCDADKVNNF